MFLLLCGSRLGRYVLFAAVVLCHRFHADDRSFLFYILWFALVRLAPRRGHCKVIFVCVCACELGFGSFRFVSSGLLILSFLPSSKAVAFYVFGFIAGARSASTLPVFMCIFLLGGCARVGRPAGLLDCLPSMFM